MSDRRDPDEARLPPSLPSFAAAVAVSAASTAVAWVLFGRTQLADVVMTYLLGIILISSRFGLGPSVLAAFLGVAAFDYFFISPVFTFAVANLRHAVTFGVMFLVAIVVSGLTERVKNQAAAARRRERRTAALYELSRALAAAEGSAQVIEVAAKHRETVFGSRVVVFTASATQAPKLVYSTPGQPPLPERELSLARWVWANRREAGLGATHHSTSSTRYVPLVASSGIVGVLGLTPADPGRFETVEERRQVDAFAAQMTLAMERAVLAEETEKARRDMETERLRNALLSSVSHDLRTPLAVIHGAASTLVEPGPAVDEETRLELLQTIVEEAERLNRLIRNLLDMTRLESGPVKIEKDWSSLEEIVGSALSHVGSRLSGRDVRVDLPSDLPLVPCDPVLLEQVLVNLLENAAKYGAAPVEVRASATEEGVRVEVADRGPGVPAGEETRIFKKFYRARRDGKGAGAGLGLAICQGIVSAHGGSIRAENRPGGGASFLFTLPIEGDPPKLPDDAEPRSPAETP